MKYAIICFILIYWISKRNTLLKIYNSRYLGDNNDDDDDKFSGGVPKHPELHIVVCFYYVPEMLHLSDRTIRAVDLNLLLLYVPENPKKPQYSLQLTTDWNQKIVHYLQGSTGYWAGMNHKLYQNDNVLEKVC